MSPFYGYPFIFDSNSTGFKTPFCNESNTQEMKNLLDSKFTTLGDKYLTGKKYDTKNKLSVNNMFALIAYSKAFFKKSSYCSDCLGEDGSIENICSQLLRMLNK